MFHHEGHKLRRVTADAEELQPIFFNKIFENRVGRNPYTMVPFHFQDLADGDERLNITPGTNYLDNEIE